MIVRWRAELAAFATLLLIYLATLAPGVTLWDSGEFLAAIHSLGIPHPPGTPLYVLISNVWSRIVSPLVGFAYSINLLSALCTAAACALFANLVNRWTGDRVAAYAGAVAAGAMASVWSSATETEVYSSALLIGCLILWIGDRAHAHSSRRWIFLAAYVAGLGFALHLTALLTVPAALCVVISRRGWRDLARNLPVLFALFLLGASVTFFMLVRAQHDPFVNQGNPSTLSAFRDVILRKQYSPAPLWPRQAPIFIQVGNLFEYADWQVGLGLAPDPPPTFFRTALTLLFGALGAVGFFIHRRLDRRSWVTLLILFLTATVGALAYLNLKASPSFGGSFIPANAKHEARERDYFFTLVWICWGLWAGLGTVRLMRRINKPALLGAMAAFVPVIFNWSAVSRHSEPAASAARREGLRVLKGTPARGIVLVHADNDVYPAWYLQEVEGRRRDATVVVVPLLPAEWYRAELARRQRLLREDDTAPWRGTESVVAEICRNAAAQNRAVVDALVSAGNTFPSPCKT